MSTLGQLKLSLGIVIVSAGLAVGQPASDYPTAQDRSTEYQLDLDCPDPCNIPGVPIQPEGEPDYCTNPEPDTFNSGCDQINSPPGPALPIEANFALWCGVTGYYAYEPSTGICRGDLNCDDFIDFDDINAYVLALSNWSAWLHQYPDCPPENANIGINEFANLLASGGGLPIPCPENREWIPDIDWYEFEVQNGPKVAVFFWHPEAAMIWELYDQAAGCGGPLLERYEVPPCLFGFQQTDCLPPGRYWMRVIPGGDAECGDEYALGLYEFVPCDF